MTRQVAYICSDWTETGRMPKHVEPNHFAS